MWSLCISVVISDVIRQQLEHEVFNRAVVSIMRVQYKYRRRREMGKSSPRSSTVHACLTRENYPLMQECVTTYAELPMCKDCHMSREVHHAGALPILGALQHTELSNVCLLNRLKTNVVQRYIRFRF